MTIDEYIVTLSASMAASKDQTYFKEYFGGYLNEFGHITELFQKLMICGVAEMCIQNFSGNLVEIGAAEGKATVALAEIAKKYNKRLLVVDPYSGAQEGTEALYDKWKVATSKYDNIDHVRLPSQSETAVAAIKTVHPCFVFVDGLHYDWAAYADIVASTDALNVGGYVCVDDTNFLKKDAGFAFSQALEKLPLELVKIPESVEKVLYTYKSWHFARKK